MHVADTCRVDSTGDPKRKVQMCTTGDLKWMLGNGEDEDKAPRIVFVQIQIPVTEQGNLFE